MANVCVSLIGCDWQALTSLSSSLDVSVSVIVIVINDVISVNGFIVADTEFCQWCWWLWWRHSDVFMSCASLEASRDTSRWVWPLELDTREKESLNVACASSSSDGVLSGERVTRATYDDPTTTTTAAAAAGGGGTACSDRTASDAMCVPDTELYSHH